MYCEKAAYRIIRVRVQGHSIKMFGAGVVIYVSLAIWLLLYGRLIYSHIDELSAKASSVPKLGVRATLLYSAHPKHRSYHTLAKRWGIFLLVILHRKLLHVIMNPRMNPKIYV